jgi:hypothetical protein
MPTKTPLAPRREITLAELDAIAGGTTTSTIGGTAMVGLGLRKSAGNSASGVMFLSISP